MQTLTLDQLPAPVLLVWGLPEDACDIKIKNDKHSDTCRLHYLANFVGLESMSKYVKWLEGNWQLIGKLSELVEAKAKELVHVSIHSGLSAHYTKGVNPTNVYCYKSSLESFHSAIEAEGYYVVNPYSEPIYTTEHSDDCYCLNCEKETKRCADLQDKARQAQSKTLPANTLIFKRV